MLENDVKFEWGETEDEAFIKIKDEWKKELELMIPNMTGEFSLEADASNVGLGAVLRQDGKPVAYISRALTKAEQNYSITEREVLASLWAMEKLKFYLHGKEFTLISDHKPIEELRKKADFGTPRLMRWIERLERFNFKCIYREGKKMIVADALSRSVSPDKEGEELVGRIDVKETVSVDTIKRVLNIHKDRNHRKNIMKLCKKHEINLSYKEIRNILKQCEICNRMDRKTGKSCIYVKTSKPGERVGIDLLEISKNDRIIVAVDYFTRKVFATVVRTKHMEKIVKFVKKVNDEFRIKTIISDNGKEFANKKFIKFCRENNIVQNFAIPYYHQSNGRVERVNRTLRDSLKRTKGLTKVVLKKIIENYNNTYHRGIKMTPNEACLEKNYEKVLEAEIKYIKEFNSLNKRQEEFMENDVVLLKNELPKSKMDEHFKEKGKIVKRVYGDVYDVEVKAKGVVRRHASQMRRL